MAVGRSGGRGGGEQKIHDINFLMRYLNPKGESLLDFLAGLVRETKPAGVTGRGVACDGVACICVSSSETTHTHKGVNEGFYSRHDSPLSLVFCALDETVTTTNSDGGDEGGKREVFLRC